MATGCTANEYTNGKLGVSPWIVVVGTPSTPTAAYSDRVCSNVKCGKHWTIKWEEEVAGSSVMGKSGECQNCFSKAAAKKRRYS